jgi:hypothetical protein
VVPKRGLYARKPECYHNKNINTSAVLSIKYAKIITFLQGEHDG